MTNIHMDTKYRGVGELIKMLYTLYSSGIFYRNHLMPRSFSLLLKSSALNLPVGWKTSNLRNHRAAELPGKYKRKADIKRQYYKRI